MRLRKSQIKRSRQDRVWWSLEERKRRKERFVLVKDVSLCHRKGHWKNDCKHRQEWLKKKEQAVEADVASGVRTPKY